MSLILKSYNSAGGLYLTALGSTITITRFAGGVSTTIAGSTRGHSGDGGAATSAQLSGAGGISVGPSGNVYFVDQGIQSVRVLLPSDPPCTYSVNSQSVTTSSAGGTIAFAVQTGASCSWAVSGLPNWITVSGSLTNSGPATVSLRIAPGAGVQRSATISVAGLPVTVTQQAGTPLAITTSSPLLSGATGLAYSQTLTASGGVPPYAWSISSGTPAAGLSLSADGAITGTPTAAGTSTFTIQVTDASKATATQSFTLTVVSVGTPVRAGSLAHVAAGGFWTTVITLVNTSSSPVAVSVILHGDDGSILSSLPVTATQQGITQTFIGNSVNALLSANTSLLLSAGDPNAQTVVGWADVLSSGPVGGFAIFRSTPTTGSPSEGTVLLQTQTPSTVVLPYDDTAGFVMGVALANLSTSSTSVTATIWDDSGTNLGIQTITIAGRGHTSFVLPTQIPPTAGKRGTVRFQSNATGGITGLGLRFSPFGTFTSVPTIIP